MAGIPGAKRCFIHVTVVSPLHVSRRESNLIRSVQAEVQQSLTTTRVSAATTESFVSFLQPLRTGDGPSCDASPQLLGEGLQLHGMTSPYTFNAGSCGQLLRLQCSTALTRNIDVVS